MPRLGVIPIFSCQNFGRAWLFIYFSSFFGLQIQFSPTTGSHATRQGRYSYFKLKLRTSFSSTTIMKLAQEHVFFETGCSFPNGNAKPPAWKKRWCRSLAQREFQGLPKIPFGWGFFSSKDVFWMNLQIKNCRWPVCLTSQNMRRLENTLKVSEYEQHKKSISSTYSSRH